MPAPLGYYQRQSLHRMRVISDWHRPLRAPQRRVMDSLVRRGLLVSQDGEYRAVPYEDLAEAQRGLFPYTCAELTAAYPDLPKSPATSA